MIEVDRLVMYRCDDEYKLAIINKDETKVALVVDNIITDFHKENLFKYKTWAPGDIGDFHKIEKNSFRDFIYGLAKDDRENVFVDPDYMKLPNSKKFKKISELIPHLGIQLEREQLAEIEKYLNKTIFKKIIEKEKNSYYAAQKTKPYVEYREF